MTLRILGDYYGDAMTWQTIDQSHIPTERYYSGLSNPFEDDTNDRATMDIMKQKYLPSKNKTLLQPDWRNGASDHFVPPPYEYRAPIIVNEEPEYHVTIEDLPEQKAKNDIEVDMNQPKPPIMDVLRQYLGDKTTQLREDDGYRDKDSVVKTLKNLGMYLPSDNKLPVAELINQARDRALKRGIDPDEYISLKDPNGNAVTTAMDLLGEKVREGMDEEITEGIDYSETATRIAKIKRMIKHDILAKMGGTAGTSPFAGMTSPEATSRPKGGRRPNVIDTGGAAAPRLQPEETKDTEIGISTTALKAEGGDEKAQKIIEQLASKYGVALESKTGAPRKYSYIGQKILEQKRILRRKEATASGAGASASSI